MSTWAEMKEEGWQLLRVDEQKGSGDKRKVFLAPARKGKRKPVSRKRDLGRARPEVCKDTLSWKK